MDVAGAPKESWEVVVVVVEEEGNVGLVAESPPAEGALKREGVCVPAAPPTPGPAAPKSGLEAPPAPVDGVVESAGLFMLPNRPPPEAGAAGVADGVLPNVGFAAPGAAVVAPKSPPEGWGWEAVDGVDEGAAEEAGVVVEPAFIPPKRLGVVVPGGGPAGVVDTLPNREPPVGAGVADEAALPNKEPPAGFAPPDIPLKAVCPVVVDSVVLAGV